MFVYVLHCLRVQEMDMLRSSVYPPLTCQAALEGSIVALDELVKAVSQIEEFDLPRAV